jgi:hypothetical protein
MNRPGTLDREFLDARSKILQLAAALDRIKRCDETNESDPRLQKLRNGIETLLSTDTDKAERIQLVFSRAYDPKWQEQFQLRQIQT